jgi:hypothetical protein
MMPLGVMQNISYNYQWKYVSMPFKIRAFVVILKYDSMQSESSEKICVQKNPCISGYGRVSVRVRANITW